MRLLYFSSGPRERVFDALLEAGHEIAAVYATDPERWPRVRPTVERAEQHGIPVRVVRERDLVELVDEISGHIVLSVGFGFIFPRGFIHAARVCLNVHGTLLPHYAGARTLNWVVAHGERQSGVTVHTIDEGVDTGPILLQRSFPLSPFETGRSLYRKTLEFEPAVVLDALERYERGVQAKPQDRNGAIRHPDRVPEHSRLDPRKSLVELFDHIRAADPDLYPAFFEMNGQRVCVRLWRPDKPADESDLI